jgi:hypothetical protein
MKHVAAYLLAVLGGKANPTEKDVTAIIAAGGGKADAEQVKKLIAEFAGKTAEQVIAAGTYFSIHFLLRSLSLVCVAFASPLPPPAPPLCVPFSSYAVQERPSSHPSPPVVLPPLLLPLPLPRVALPLPPPRLPPRHLSPNLKRRRPAVSPFLTRKRSFWIAIRCGFEDGLLYGCIPDTRSSMHGRSFLRGSL